MPVYDYKCAQHGIFHELSTMADSANPKPCPKCGTQSARIIMLPPDLLMMDESKRHAHATNEKSQHEPVISTVASRDEKHGRGCGCEKKHKLSQQVVLLPDGSKVFPSQRPWMISH